MSLRIHLVGTMCSGKTTIIDKIREEFPHIESWDIKNNFYIPEKIVTSNGFDWDRFKKKADLIENRINQFLEENADVPVIHESSGFNTRINMAIKGKGFVAVCLVSPAIGELKHRAKERGDNVDRVLEFASVYNRHMHKIRKYIPQLIGSDRATKEIRKQLRLYENSQQQRTEQ